MKKSLKLRNVIAVLAVLTAMPLLIGAGCSGSSGGNMIPSIRIPGMNSSTGDLAQLGAKTLDVIDLESPQRQEEIGQSVAVAITNRYRLSNDQALTDYVNLVGLTVASVSSNPDINYSFGVLDTPDVSAYSAPGGYVFITTGAIKLLQDEAELAGVLAHEVAHVSLNHGIEAVKAAKQADWAASAVRTQGGQVAQYGRLVDSAVDSILVKGYNRSQENAADAQAVKYLAAAGYDTAGLLRFLQRMQTATGSSSTGARQLMSTHPGTGERITRVQSQIASMRGGQTLKDRFASNVKP